VTSHELLAATEGIEDPFVLQDDHRDDDRPQGQEYQAGNDQEHKTDSDPEPGEKAGTDHRAELGAYPPEGVADREIRPTIANIRDRLGQCSLHEIEPDDRDCAYEKGADPTQRGEEKG
jgi:hypothetical protein